MKITITKKARKCVPIFFLLCIFIIILIYKKEELPSLSEKQLINLMLEKTSFCTIYNHPKEVENGFSIINFNSPSGTFPIFVVDSNMEMLELSGRSYEKRDKLEGLHDFLQNNTDLHLIDVGCGMGLYSYTALRMSRQVVAVDANPENIRLVWETILLNKMTSQMTLVHNAIGHEHRTVSIQFHKTRNDQMENDADTQTFPVQTIFLDDLLEVTSFKKAVLRINIKGFEYAALKQADMLFKALDIRAVLMQSIPTGHKKSNIQQTFINDFFRRNGFELFENLQSTKPLSDDYDEYPLEIVWKKKLVTAN